MRATTRTTRSSRRPLIAALALVLGGTLLTPPVPEAHAEESVRSAVRAIVAERLEGISREQCREACRRTGALRLRGRHRLAGHVFAESLHVEPGADVVIEAGATIFVTGDITIDAPVTTAPAPVTEDPKAFLIGPPDDQVPPPGAILGANGTNNVDIVFICDQGGDFFTSEPLLGGDGGAGGSLNLANAPDGAVGIGGRGGKGVGFVIDCADGTVTVGHNIVPGRGGAGGSVTIVGSNGTPGTSQDGASVTACGGRGGDSGDVRIVCGTIVFLTDDQDAAIGRIGIRAAGVGGAADATGGDGADMISCDDDGGPGNGGKGLAVGGAGGTSTLGVIEADRIVPDRFDARDIISFEDVTEFPDGGAAVGAGGDGGDAADCTNPPGVCPDKGKRGSDGGKGGLGEAVGGAGGFGGRIGAGKGGGLFRKVQSGAEQPSGTGGFALAFGGNGGDGGNGENGRKPGNGGSGGRGGQAKARGGGGGDSKLFEKGGIVFGLPSGLIASGASGGAATLAGLGGNGGDGGDCCDNPGGAGGQRGLGGLGGFTRTRPGRPGKGKRKGPRGERSPGGPGGDGLDGVDGRPCNKLGIDGLILVDLVPFGPGGGVVGEPLPFDIDLRNSSQDAIGGLTLEIRQGRETLFSTLATVPGASGSVLGQLLLPVDVTPTKAGKRVKISLHVNGRKASTRKIKIAKPPKGGGGCDQSLIDGNDHGTFSILISRDGSPVFGGEHLNPLPVGVTLTMGGTLFEDNAPGDALTNAVLSVKIDGREVYRETVAGPVTKLAAAPERAFSLPSPGGGCIEVFLNDILDYRLHAGTTQ